MTQSFGYATPADSTRTLLLKDSSEVAGREEFLHRNGAGIGAEKPVCLLLVFPESPKQLQHRRRERLHAGAVASAFVHRHHRRIALPLVIRE